MVNLWFSTSPHCGPPVATNRFGMHSSSVVSQIAPTFGVPRTLVNAAYDLEPMASSTFDLVLSGLYPSSLRSTTSCLPSMPPWLLM